MFYEDVVIRRGDTVSGLGAAYGHPVANWRTIWDDSENYALRLTRGVPEQIQPGDTLMIPIPWAYTNKVLTVEARGVGLEARRSGGRGTRLNWVQTVYQSNQPIGTTTTHCVDACPANDADPYYYTAAQFTTWPEWRVQFSDHPTRDAPTAAQGTTAWRAVVSMCTVTGQRITVYNSLTWGFDMTSANVITRLGPRNATSTEVRGHLNLLRNGVGTGTGTFASRGWNFRKPPERLGDFPLPAGDTRAA